ncbi:hypothetical protein [uncultured Meiothermus sp.]|uniref:hypothetical protein n=1 Tax=uncultured Meiothermus sp. TaxID=157471 RepID=UPI00262446C2|nr:hypothetical protein [uncultured Meiothermus sp.]
MNASPVALPNPLSVQFWLWGQDALRGDLEAQGFRKTSNPTGKGSSIYRWGEVGLHSSAAWLETAEGVLVYSRPREGFFGLPHADGLRELPSQPKALEFWLGLAHFQPFVSAYEAWILGCYGPKHRIKQLKQLPRAAQRCRPAWEAWICPAPPRRLITPAPPVGCGSVVGLALDAALVQESDHAPGQPTG